jgi:hypothetical protein
MAHRPTIHRTADGGRGSVFGWRAATPATGAVADLDVIRVILPEVAADLAGALLPDALWPGA